MNLVASFACISLPCLPTNDSPLHKPIQSFTKRIFSKQCRHIVPQSGTVVTPVAAAFPASAAAVAQSAVQDPGNEAAAAGVDLFASQGVGGEPPHFLLPLGCSAVAAVEAAGHSLVIRLGSTAWAWASALGPALDLASGRASGRASGQASGRALEATLASFGSID